ncbi:MAG: ATP synthase F0 subunit C [Candidatus Latescibacterota bacterium]
MELVIFAKFIGASIAVATGAIGSGFSEGIAAGKASESISRQPKVSGEILRTMLISQAVTETSGIFGLLVAILLLFVAPVDGGPSIVAAYIAAGFCVGVGGIGAGIGCGIIGGTACESTARHPRISNIIVLNTLVGQAITQTGCIFALVISLVLIFMTPESTNIGVIGGILGAGFSMGIGAIGAGTNSGYVTARANWAIARNSKTSSLVLRVMLLGQAVDTTVVIFSMIIAFLLLLVHG